MDIQNSSVLIEKLREIGVLERGNFFKIKITFGDGDDLLLITSAERLARIIQKIKYGEGQYRILTAGENNFVSINSEFIKYIRVYPATEFSIEYNFNMSIEEAKEHLEKWEVLCSG